MFSKMKSSLVTPRLLTCSKYNNRFEKHPSSTRISRSFSTIREDEGPLRRWAKLWIRALDFQSERNRSVLLPRRELVREAQRAGNVLAERPDNEGREEQPEPTNGQLRSAVALSWKDNDGKATHPFGMIHSRTRSQKLLCPTAHQPQ